MIYDHSLVDGWRNRVGKEELAARDSLRKFITQRKGAARPASAVNGFKYNARNGPWANGGNYGDARFDQPFSDLQERRLRDNINVWDKGYRPPPVKAISPAKQTAMLKSQKKMEDGLQDAENGEGTTLVSARTRLSTPDSALLRISPLTDIVPQSRTKGICHSWSLLESDPVKIQLKQEADLGTQGSLENHTMIRINPLMRMRPKTASTSKSLSHRPHFRKTEEGYGNLGEDGSRGDVKMGWITQNMIPTQAYAEPLSTKRSQRSTARSRSSYGSRSSSRASSRSAGGRRRRELENLIGRVKDLEAEIDDVRVAREEVEDELAMTRSKIAAEAQG